MSWRTSCSKFARLRRSRTQSSSHRIGKDKLVSAQPWRSTCKSTGSTARWVLRIFAFRMVMDLQSSPSSHFSAMRATPSLFQAHATPLSSLTSTSNLRFLLVRRRLPPKRTSNQRLKLWKTHTSKLWWMVPNRRQFFSSNRTTQPAVCSVRNVFLHAFNGPSRRRSTWSAMKFMQFQCMRSKKWIQWHRFGSMSKRARRTRATRDIKGGFRTKSILLVASVRISVSMDSPSDLSIPRTRTSSLPRDPHLVCCTKCHLIPNSFFKEFSRTKNGLTLSLRPRRRDWPPRKMLSKMLWRQLKSHFSSLRALWWDGLISEDISEKVPGRRRMSSGRNFTMRLVGWSREVASSLLPSQAGSASCSPAKTSRTTIPCALHSRSSRTDSSPGSNGKKLRLARNELNTLLDPLLD